MAAYPTSPAWSHPVTRSLEFQTLVGQGEDGSEQRSMIHAGRESWQLSYPHLSLAERDTLITAFEAAKGSFDETLSFTFLGTTFTGCYFDADKFSAVESLPKLFAANVKLCQVIRAPDSGSFPSDFPALTSGAKMQRPYTYERGFDNVSVRTEGGRYNYYRRPSSLRTWSAGGPLLSTTEAQAIWDMFRLAAGRFRSFGFTDPDSGTRYANCRFGLDTLDWRMTDNGQNSIQVTIQELV
jgi:hypothetical protein